MFPRVFMFLTGAVYIYYQVLAAEDVYIAELMVESNVTVKAQTVLSILKTPIKLQVISSSGYSHTVTILQLELTSECVIVGDETNCTCSVGYIWSNDVCYSSKCCRESSCSKNVSHITPLCIAKVKVHINGSVTLSAGAWDNAETTQLESALGELNGFQYLNVTGCRLGNRAADFEAAVSVKFVTSKLQDIVTDLETNLKAVIWADTVGMVTIESPETTVCYMSDPQFKCTFEETTGSAGWNMSRKHKRFELNNGSVVKLDHNCATKEYNSCIAFTLQKVTGMWAGTYECGFVSGSVRHTAKTELSVAVLPDEIMMKIDPLTADCSKSSDIHINVTATIPKSTETLKVIWTNANSSDPSNTPEAYHEDYYVYAGKARVMCQKMIEAQYVKVIFRNTKGQEESAQVTIPVIYEGKKFCNFEEINGDRWPKTPAGDTVINPKCAEGRVGYKSRTCEGTTWQQVFSYCVNQELNKVLNKAEDFQKGLDATQKGAMDIFEGIKNSSTFDSDSSDTTADISASINILSVMANASQNIVLQEEVFPGFVDAASNMLNKTWVGVNSSILQSMASNYLQSVEDLVKNIKVNNTIRITRKNLDLSFCSSTECSVSVFDISVNLNKTTGIMKTVAVKNLMDKLRNNFHKTVPSSLLISATLEDNNDSSLEITLDFPNEQQNSTKPFCVFWSTGDRNWSDAGCIVNSRDSNHTLCKCNHLTSFSILMAKSDISSKDLDIITLVGLGVSICSLLIFLIIESLVWSAVVKTNLSHFRHTAMVNIATFLLLADCSFLASTSREILTDTWCLALTICKHLFFLAMFCWMLCMSVMLVHQLIFVFSPLRKRVFMFLSSIVGYVCPILIVGSSYVYYKYTNKPYYCKKTCWLVFEGLLEGSVHAFLLPVGTVILTNLFCMVVVILTLVKPSVPDGNKADEKETAKSILKVVVFLTPVFGVTWVIGFFQLMLNQDDSMMTVVQYSFTILNSFQGLFILVTACFTEKKVREELLKLIMEKSKRKSDSMKNLTSTIYTKDK